MITQKQAEEQVKNEIVDMDYGTAMQRFESSFRSGEDYLAVEYCSAMAFCAALEKAPESVLQSGMRLVLKVQTYRLLMDKRGESGSMKDTDFGRGLIECMDQSKALVETLSPVLDQLFDILDGGKGKSKEPEGQNLEAERLVRDTLAKARGPLH